MSRIMAGGALVLSALSCLLLSLPGNAAAQDQKKYWVWFADKGPDPAGQNVHGALRKGSVAFADAAAFVQPRAIARRAKILPPERLLDADDLSLYEPYVHAVETAGGVLRQRVRWMNAASFLLSPEQVRRVAALPGIRAVSPVRILHALPDHGNVSPPPPAAGSFAKTASLDYGLSAQQLEGVNVPPLHDLGVTGEGVLIGMLDSGFRWRGHQSLQSRKVIAEHDFIFNDGVTANEANDSPDQDRHGTLTFSTIGGYAPGTLIGPAFNAEFILGKTEYIPSETMIEEDNWAAGIEWMESMGVDVVSSSLGYDTFDDGSGYTWENGDFNGRTTITAKAAMRAARLGVLVCNAMGNEYNGDGITGRLLTPADADSIVAVGAINFSLRLAPFSSTGPTNDGRIKPDVVAPGVGIYCANANISNGYFYESGTSLATPLAGGAAALILSARPELVPQQIIDALRNTADTNLDPDTRWNTYPNNFVGWGTVNALKAALSFGPIFGNTPSITSNASANIVRTRVMSKFGIKADSVLYYYTTGSDTVYTPLAMHLDSATSIPSSGVYGTSGVYSLNLPALALGTPVHFYVEAHDSSGRSYQSPAAVRRTVWQFTYGSTVITTGPGVPQSYRLVQNFPNPFNPGTTITTMQFDTPTSVTTEITLYNLLGQRVRTLFKGSSLAARNQVGWDGNDDHGTPLATGMYLCQMVTQYNVSTIKLMLIR